MSYKFDLTKYSFLVYGLGETGKSVISFFKRKRQRNFHIWDDNIIYKKKINIKDIIKKVDFIVLSPGISLRKSKFKKELIQFKDKIITDIDLLYLTNKKLKSIMVTGSNGKSTTCKIIHHLLNKINYNVKLGGNIGTPVLDLKIKKNTFLIIEASSFQLSYSKYIRPNFAILLNITNDHLDWHGTKQNYIMSKMRIFSNQKRSDFAFINNNFKELFKKKKYLSKFIQPKMSDYFLIKNKLNNKYLTSHVNNENMNFVYSLSKILKIKKNLFIKSLSSFSGLDHRYEIFLKRKNVTFINDSKATNFEASKYALMNNKNIYWILGGLAKDKDKFNLNKDLTKNISCAYIIGKNTNYFKDQLGKKVKIFVTKNLKQSIMKIMLHIKNLKDKEITILLSPSAASFDQFKNFENRGNEFKRLSKTYAKKFI